MPKSAVYLESSVISYLVAKPSRDPIIAGHQQATAQWWRHRRGDFDLYLSQSVLNEISAGDTGYAAKRLAFVPSPSWRPQWRLCRSSIGW